MSGQTSALVRLCRISSPYGVKGWCRAVDLEISPAALPCPVFFSDSPNRPSGCESVFSLESYRISPSLLKFSHVSTPEEASLLKGLYLFIDRAYCSSLDVSEYYDQDLIGLSVINSAGANCGRVVAVLEQLAHFIISVEQSDGSFVMVPFVADWVSEVDIIAGHMVVPNFEFLK